MLPQRVARNAELKPLLELQDEYYNPPLNIKLEEYQISSMPAFQVDYSSNPSTKVYSQRHN